MNRKKQQKIVKIFALFIVAIMLFQVLMPLFNSFTINGGVTANIAVDNEENTSTQINSTANIESNNEIAVSENSTNTTSSVNTTDSPVQP